MGDFLPDADHIQDRNAGNLGDLLKHFYLIQSIAGLLDSKAPSKVAYLESHAGAGDYHIGEIRIREIERNK